MLAELEWIQSSSGGVNAAVTTAPTHGESISIISIAEAKSVYSTDQSNTCGLK